jgi:hypothetical protein
VRYSSRTEAEARSKLIGHVHDASPASRKSICAAGAALIVRLAIAGAALVLPLHSALAQFIEQGPKLVGSGGSTSHQGHAVALSADGNTAIVSGIADNGLVGAVWVFTRSGGVWSPQGAKLVGSGAIGPSEQGTSVALSGDGNTAIVGGPGDNSNVGAAWVFTRSGGVWTQQGDKLIGSGGGTSQQGTSVALSQDGNTAMVGGTGDNNPDGAAWVYTRSPSGWSQQGAKLTGDAGSHFGGSVALSADGNIALVSEPTFNSNAGAVVVFGRSGGVWTVQNALIGTGNVGAALQGISLALSADGRTAIVGGPGDNSSAGAAWVFIRTGANSWFQQGNKLMGSGAIGAAEQGFSVGLSADGNTAIVGGMNDNSGIGAAWVFTRSGTAWTQLGAKLVGAGNSGAAQEGFSVALSGDGQTGILGGPTDNFFAGAAWVFARSRAGTHDFNGDSISDIAWRDGGGNVAFWVMNGAAVTSSGGTGGVPATWSIVGQRDFDKDGKADLLWRDTSGNTAIWFMNGATVGSSVSVGNIPTSWSVIGTGDFDGNGFGDIIWRDNTGNVAVWLMNGATISSSGGLGNVPLTWNIVGTGDYDGNGTSDLLWRDSLGNTSIWFMNGTQIASTGAVGNVSTVWSVVGTGDFDGNGKSDIVWRDNTGNTSIWLMNGATVASAGALGVVPTTWSIAQTGDYNGDGMSDLLWRDNAGNTSMWFMNGAAVTSIGNVGNIPTSWTVQSVNAE